MSYVGRWTTPMYRLDDNGEAVEIDQLNARPLEEGAPREIVGGIPLEEYHRERLEQRSMITGSLEHVPPELRSRHQPIAVPPDHVLVISPAGHLVNMPESELRISAGNVLLPAGFRLATKADIEAKQAAARSGE